MSDQINVQIIIEKDMGDNGTWRDALYIPLEEYQAKVAEKSFDDWKDATKEERYSNFIAATTPDPVKVLQDQADSIADQIAALTEEHENIYQQIRDIDAKAVLVDLSEQVSTRLSPSIEVSALEAG